jgi:hypothetical protein
VVVVVGVSERGIVDSALFCSEQYPSTISLAAGKVHFSAKKSWHRMSVASRACD